MFNKKKVLCVVCSAGGHLTEALIAIAELHFPIYFVTYRSPHLTNGLKGRECYFIMNPHKYIYKYPINFFQSLVLYIKKKPKYILSTGAGVAIATCLIGKLMGSKIIYIETGARIYTPSLTGRLIYPWADLFIVQWRPLLKFFPKAKYGGLLF